MENFKKANELYTQKNYLQALNYYQKAIAEKDNEATSLYNAAVCYIKLKNFNHAIPLLNSAISLKQDSKYYFNLAYCYAQLKNIKKALLYFNTSWALDNEDKDCEKAINIILSKLQKTP